MSKDCLRVGLVLSAIAVAKVAYSQPAVTEPLPTTTNEVGATATHSPSDATEQPHGLFEEGDTGQIPPSEEQPEALDSTTDEVTEPPLEVQETPRPSHPFVPENTLRIAVDTRQSSLSTRIETISESLLGAGYKIDPLGEGRPPDLDPMTRYDLFDCLTYVEEVLALSLSADPRHAGEIRHALRYGTNPADYHTRHHFMELQWLPSAIANGWLVDTTASYGTVAYREKWVTPETWEGWRKTKLFKLGKSEFPTGKMSLSVLPLEDAIERADRFRSGSIILIVRQDQEQSPIWVSHIGLIIQGKHPTLRHATRMGGGAVRDHNLVWYLNNTRSYTAWPIAGVAILEPVEQGPRRALFANTSP